MAVTFLSWERLARGSMVWPSLEPLMASIITTKENGTTSLLNSKFMISTVSFLSFPPLTVTSLVCNGHAANGQYHHHHYPVCLAERLGDYGLDHSAIWGWMLDGYPIYGPYQDAKQLAVSC
jgi:hypothetical protein